MKSQDPIENLKTHLRRRKTSGAPPARLSPEARSSMESWKKRKHAKPDPTPAAKSTTSPVTPSVPSRSTRTPAAPAAPASPQTQAQPQWSLQLPEGDKPSRFAWLRDTALACSRCSHLASFRKQVVFGVGNPDASLMFVGEAPGADEDEQGIPFVGRAGQLLTKMIEAMGLKRDDVYIANVLKCRPDMPPNTPGNRKPTLSEMDTCAPYLHAQIELIRPRVMVALGATAVQGLLRDTSPMGKLRGQWREYRGIPLMLTYHPSYLLHNSSITEKRKVWEDLMKAMEKLELPISDKQKGYFLQ